MKLDTGIYAKVIADSIANDVRLTTLELRYPRFILAEFNTHRVFSRNSSSSRAIPTNKISNQVFSHSAKPVEWGLNQSGMQSKELIAAHKTSTCNYVWNTAAREATKFAKQLQDLGLHKQVVNRVLEPYQFVSTVVTATEWDNFFQLRLHEDADPTIQELARCMKNAMVKSEPYVLYPDDYHLPYVTGEEEERCSSDTLLKASVARCARTSYLNHDNSNPDIEKDLELAEKLLEAKHFSPFEHQAFPMRDRSSYMWEDGVTHTDVDGNDWSANFRGWIQYRQTL